MYCYTIKVDGRLHLRGTADTPDLARHTGMVLVPDDLRVGHGESCGGGIEYPLETPILRIQRGVLTIDKV